MAEKIDPTWLAYALTHPASADRIEAGLGRLADHYGELVDYPLAISKRAGERLGVAVLGDPDSLCAWPHFSESGPISVASAYVPQGWERLTGPVPPGEAAVPLGRALLAAPERCAESLTGPAVLGVLDGSAERLVVVNDCIGAGRLYETKLRDGVVWSNRAGAGNLFAGIPVEPDERGWQLLAAVGWFAGSSTPLRGVCKVERGTVIEAGPNEVRTHRTGAVGRLVAGAEGPDELLAPAAEHLVEHVREAQALWQERPVIHLSGGRDSRLVAAAAVAGEVEAVFRTSDNTPGEADVARRLVAAAPFPMEHLVVQTEDEGGPRTPLLDRALRGQLLHDGMRHASKIRRDVRLPRSRPKRATLPGWGGEIAHAFYYQDTRQLRKVAKRGRKRVLTRLLQSSRKKHDAAHDSAYDVARDEFERAIAAGEAHGLRGPDLLDWFYLVERFVHRYEVGADSQSVSVFTTPAFIRLAFATSPEQRLQAQAHRELIARLVPAWSEVPFYVKEPGPRPRLRRRRLWEAPDDARAIEEIIATDGPWAGLFRPERIREMWAEARAGGGFGDWETVFERVVFRAAFDSYRDTLNRRAAQGPPLAA